MHKTGNQTPDGRIDIAINERILLVADDGLMINTVGVECGSR